MCFEMLGLWANFLWTVMIPLMLIFIISPRFLSPWSSFLAIFSMPRTSRKCFPKFYRLQSHLVAVGKKVMDGPIIFFCKFFSSRSLIDCFECQLFKHGAIIKARIAKSPSLSGNQWTLQPNVVCIRFYYILTIQTSAKNQREMVLNQLSDKVILWWKIVLWWKITQRFA